MDYRSRRLRTGLLLGTAFLGGIAIGPASGLIGRHFGYDFGLSAFAAQDANRTDTYRLLTLFGDVFERVRAEYVDPVSDKDLIENSINGMLTGLDPHSSYMNAKAFRDMQVQTKGEFGGLGIEVTQDNGFIKVISPIDDTPAFKAGSEGRRHHHRAGWQDRAGALAAGRSGHYARGAEFENHADHQA